MPQENVEVVRTLLSAFDRADYEAALEALDSEIEWQVPPGIAIGREVYRGRDEVEVHGDNSVAGVDRSRRLQLAAERCRQRDCFLSLKAGGARLRVRSADAPVSSADTSSRLRRSDGVSRRAS